MKADKYERFCSKLKMKAIFCCFNFYMSNVGFNDSFILITGEST